MLFHILSSIRVQDKSETFCQNYFDAILQSFTSTIYVSGGAKIAGSTSIDILLRSPFNVSINETTFTINPPDQGLSSITILCYHMTKHFFYVFSMYYIHKGNIFICKEVFGSFSFSIYFFMFTYIAGNLMLNLRSL